jgi:hypothetical protein
MNGVFEFFTERAGMFGCDTGHEHALFAFQKSGRNFDNLPRRFAGTENHFRKTLAQCAVHVHLRKAQVHDRRGLKCAHDFFARDFPGAERLQKFYGFTGCHKGSMAFPHKIGNGIF